MRRTLPLFYNKTKDLIQCQECKKWFKMLSNHLSKIHYLSGDEYKNKYGLINGDLVALSVRYNMSDSGIKFYLNNPTRRKMLAKNSRENLKKCWSMSKHIKPRVKEIQSQNKISSEQRENMNEGIRKFAKSKRGKEIYKKTHEKQKRGKIIRCKCGKKFYLKRCILKQNNHANYCSVKCKGIYEPKTRVWRNNHKEGLNKKYKDKRIKTKCKDCGKVFTNIISRKYKFCSWRCYKRWYKKNALTRQPDYYRNYYKINK